MNNSKFLRGTKGALINKDLVIKQNLIVKASGSDNLWPE
jgi:hypothetical protein